MRRTVRRAANVTALTAALIVFLPGVAQADNCGSLSDCYYTARAALAALVGLSVLLGVLLSVTLDFTPGVGTVKGVIEAYTGKDLITGQELAWWERVLGVVPVLGGVVGGIAAAGKLANAADAVGDVGRATGKAGDAADSAGDVARGGERGSDAGDAAKVERTPATLDDSMSTARPAEQATAQRLADNPDFDGRQFSAPPPPDPGYDWVDDLGRTYDAMGDGTKSEYFRIDQFKRAIDSHLLKGNDFTVIDVTGYNADQIAAIKEYVDGLSAAQQATIVRVGF